MSVNRREVLKLAGVGAAALTGGAAITQGRAVAGTPAATAIPAASTTVSDVSFVGASSSGTRRKMILDVLEPWRSKVAAGITGKTILVKANLLSLTSGEGDAEVLPVTHVDALRGLLDFLRSISSSVPIVIGDCSVNPNISSIWTRAGYKALTTEYPGVTLMDLGDTSNLPAAGQTIWKPDLSETTTIPISSAFTDPKYYLITICRPKTHDTVVMTATGKNVLMAAPLRSATVDGTRINPKGLMHGRGSGVNNKPDEAKCLSYNLFQLANVIYSKGGPALCVLDAWEGMEGNGPAGGSSVMQYAAVAGTDTLAVDRLCAMLMGFSDIATDPVDPDNPSYADMRYLKWISDAGFGNYDLSKINFILGSLSEARGYIKKYDMHSNYASETGWIGGPPPKVLGTAGSDVPPLDPKPFLLPQPNALLSAEDASVTFALPAATGVRLGIFSAEGVEVRRLTHGFLTAGRYTVSWDGRDSSGSPVPAGSYRVRLGFGSYAPGAAERSLEDRVRLAR